MERDYNDEDSSELDSLLVQEKEKIDRFATRVRYSWPVKKVRDLLNSPISHRKTSLVAKYVALNPLYEEDEEFIDEEERLRYATAWETIMFWDLVETPTIADFEPSVPVYVYDLIEELTAKNEMKMGFTEPEKLFFGLVMQCRAIYGYRKAEESHDMISTKLWETSLSRFN